VSDIWIEDPDLSDESEAIKYTNSTLIAIAKAYHTYENCATEITLSKWIDFNTAMMAIDNYRGTKWEEVCEGAGYVTRWRELSTRQKAVLCDFELVRDEVQEWLDDRYKAQHRQTELRRSAYADMCKALNSVGIFRDRFGAMGSVCC